MKASYRIESPRGDITPEIRSRLIELTITDESGGISDACSLVLSDEPELIERPQAGDTLRVALGYEEVLIEMGRFTLKPIEAKGYPSQLKLTATAIAGAKSLLSKKERSWNNQSIGDIAREIAAENGLTAAVSSYFDGIKIKHIDQHESDSSFLSRIAEIYDGVYKPFEDRLILIKKGESETASGRKIEPITISRVKDYSLSTSTEKTYTGVKAFYWDERLAERKEVLEGAEESVFEIDFLMTDKAMAESIAASKLQKLERESSKLTLTVTGNQELFAERKAEISGVRPDVDGTWLITKVTHTLNASGYISKVELERTSE
ncbi:phage late control D family protein [Pseudobacteriovorax antillogorgiicola]|uniref:Phage protein D n=1 Tax=Pseudobacteriovorax antillogorgiicola TaxID=1513793 RepID=A0A1Y6CY31_9BACT|nr:contractile injection system protein, VgrG/Pvc8 family [Pseudobacteriovorax antillogorgiicola]TCS44273.1 hypothetical protein EDD56_13473 [Pseudobacteriovorax antillogorgiicola]SMF84379.1 hypothetical protein SAMN06296036_1545 [Pseudobacteriovorax antillogorgiicola]